MTTVKREELLSQLEMVKAGLSPREFIEQSSCFCFGDGKVMTFNDEIACRVDCVIDTKGAVQSTSLLAILDKLKEDAEFRVHENEHGELEFVGKQDAFGVPRDPELYLPIDRVEKAENWYPIPDGFIKAIKQVGRCVSTDESRFTLTCVHIHPEYIEACDNMRVMRVRLDTGLKTPVLIRGTSVEPMTMLGMTKMAQTPAWMHFKNKAGLQFSVRQYSEKYPQIDPLMDFTGEKISLPKSVTDVTDRAAVFASDRAGDALVSVKLWPGKIKISGRGYSGWYKGIREVEYQGPKLRFLIQPETLVEICENYSSCQVTPDKLKVSGKNDKKHPWCYVTVLGEPEETEEDRSVPRKKVPQKKKQQDEESDDAEE